MQWGLFFDKNHPILEKTISNVTKNIITNKYPNYLLFLATDDLKIINILKNMYSKKLISSNIKLAPNKNKINAMRNMG